VLEKAQENSEIAANILRQREVSTDAPQNPKQNEAMNRTFPGN